MADNNARVATLLREAADLLSGGATAQAPAQAQAQAQRRLPNRICINVETDTDTRTAINQATTWMRGQVQGNGSWRFVDVTAG